MKTLLNMSLGFLLVSAAPASAGDARAAQVVAADTCETYGFVPHTRDYRVCRVNLRHYWSTGPCRHAGFAAAHPRYCNLIPTLDF